MEIALCGRNVEVPQHFQAHTAEKLARLERYDHKIIRMDVELSHEPNRRQAKICQRVQITGRGRGPVVRGEGCAADFYSALDQALARMERRLHRAHDRRLAHRGRRTPVTAGATLLEERPDDELTEIDDDLGPGEVPAAREPTDDPFEDGAEPDVDDGPGRVVRRKEHQAGPMTVDDALSQMELVGHDFFLFADADTGRPSVVYRRRGYDYGVIALA